MTNAQLEALSRAAAQALGKDGFATDRELELARGVVALFAERDALIDGVLLSLQRLNGSTRLSDEKIVELWKHALDLATPGWR